MNLTPEPITVGFGGLGIAPALLDLLEKNGMKNPTPIQHKSIPVAIEGKDIIGIAQTGTGKTLAFGIPLLQRLQQHGGRALIVVPTRELAYQVDETLQKYAPKIGIRTAVFIGGASMHLQRQMIKRNPRILVATPGRLIDHLQQKTITLREVSILVLDEADRMLDMGFAPQINEILKHVPRERQTMLFSATMPADIVTLATKHMKLPLRIEVARSGTTADKVEQELYVVRKEEKMQVLGKLLTDYRGSVLVFSRTKHGAKKICQSVKLLGHSSAELHSNKSLSQRRQALDGFKSGAYRVLVATDIVARGIDVTGIELVINFDLPNNAEDYVHRIGRTGRAGMAGRAISLATPDQRNEISDIERLIRSPIKKSTMAGQAVMSDSPAAASAPRRGYSSPHSGPRRPSSGGAHGRPGGSSGRWNRSR